MHLRSIRLAPLAEQYYLTHSIQIFPALPFLLCPPVTGLITTLCLSTVARTEATLGPGVKEHRGSPYW